MKKEITIILLFFSLLALTLWVMTGWRTAEQQTRTINCEKNRLIFSITSFDGENESAPFVNCLGHTWLSLDNQYDHSVFVKDQQVRPGEILTFSIWAITEHRGVVYDLEPAFIEQCGRYVGRQTLSVNIDEAQLRLIEDYIDRNDDWTPGKNCSRWSVELWNELVEEELRLNVYPLINTPKRLLNDLRSFDCVVTDQDFTRAKEIFFFQNSEKMELKLCS